MPAAQCFIWTCAHQLRRIQSGNKQWWRGSESDVKIKLPLDTSIVCDFHTDKIGILLLHALKIAICPSYHCPSLLLKTILHCFSFNSCSLKRFNWVAICTCAVIIQNFLFWFCFLFLHFGEKSKEESTWVADSRRRTKLKHQSLYEIQLWWEWGKRHWSFAFKMFWLSMVPFCKTNISRFCTNFLTKESSAQF